jgi:hypothetical protein
MERCSHSFEQRNEHLNAHSTACIFYVPFVAALKGCATRSQIQE